MGSPYAYLTPIRCHVYVDNVQLTQEVAMGSWLENGIAQHLPYSNRPEKNSSGAIKGR